VVLTGGRSRRMGRDKAWLPVGGVPCVVRVWEACRAAGLPVAFQGYLEGLQERFPGVPVWDDPEPGGGPLGALAAALGRAGGPVLLLACDLPFLTAGFLHGVLEALPGHDWAVPEEGGRLHPVAGAYAPTALGPARALLARGERRMGALLADPDLRGRRVPLEPAWGDPTWLLSNLNTAEDWARADAHARTLEA